MAKEELIRLCKLPENLYCFFHRGMHYLDGDIAEQMTGKCYPRIRYRFLYWTVWICAGRGCKTQVIIY